MSEAMSGSLVTDAVLTEVSGRVLHITLNRPEVRNAIDSNIGEGLLAAVGQLDDDPTLAVGVVSGNGPAFCSGIDLKAFAASGLPRGMGRFYAYGARKPLLCAVEGFALAGGFELALTCDLIIAARDATFGIPEVRMGLFTAGGAPLRLPRHVPYGIAMELALTGEPITAEDAHRYGLVTKLAEPGQALDVALALAEQVARNGAVALVATKQLIREAHGRTETEFWEFQRPLVKQLFVPRTVKEEFHE